MTPVTPSLRIAAAHTNLDVPGFWAALVSELAVGLPDDTVYDASGPVLTVVGAGAFEHLVLGGALRDSAKVEIKKLGRPAGYAHMRVNAATPGAVVLVLSPSHTQDSF
jgi:hypothetical protein